MARPVLPLVVLLTALGCSGAEDCRDLRDNDGDGFVDCRDDECAFREGCVGAPCVTGLECQGNVCLSEIDNGFPGGSCTDFCQLSAPSCPRAVDGACVDINLGDGRGICLNACEAAADCRPGAAYRCAEGESGLNACFPDCRGDSDCEVTGVCNLDNGFCKETREDCDNRVDDDGEGLADCSDRDCGDDPACDPGAACAAAAPAGAGTLNGDTSGALSRFKGSCLVEIGQGAGEEIFAFTAASPRALSLTVESGSSQGLYVRADCLDPESELGCVDGFNGVGELILPEGSFAPGEPLFVFVDGFLPGQEGPFTLTIAAIPPEADCGDLLDNDFDGTLDCRDADICAGSAACTPGATPTGGGCAASSECTAAGGAPECLGEAALGFPGGYCSELCSLSAGACGDQGICVDVFLSTGEGLCLATCAEDVDCPAAYRCFVVAGLAGKACLPDCTSDADCPETGICNADIGRCAAVREVCDNIFDDDQDGLNDCEDATCAGIDPFCDESLNCSDTFDNDLDGFIDCGDVEDCAGDPGCG